MRWMVAPVKRNRSARAKRWSEPGTRRRPDPEPVCGYADPFGGPCLLRVNGHPTNGRGELVHDDGKARR